MAKMPLLDTPDVRSKLVHEKPGFKMIEPGKRNALTTEEVVSRLTSAFPELTFPFIQQDHLHGVVSNLHTICKHHGVVSKVSMASALYGGLRYGCDVCAAQNGARNRRANSRYDNQTLSRRKLQSGIFLAVKKICPDTEWEVTLPDGKELDIYIPSLRLGIEHNGLYWHSDQIKKDKNYHRNKNASAAHCDIAVIHVWEDLAIEPFTAVTNMVRVAKGDIVLPNRKGEVRVVPTDEALSFHRQWNLRPTEVAERCSDHVGFYMRGKLKGLMSLKSNYVLAISCSAVGVPFGEIAQLLKSGFGYQKLYCVADCITPLESSLARGFMKHVKDMPPLAWNLDANNHLCCISKTPPSGNVVWDCGYLKFEL